jgi:hypothetical protein
VNYEKFTQELAAKFGEINKQVMLDIQKGLLIVKEPKK